MTEAQLQRARDFLGVDECMFRELKSETGRLRPEQLDWLSRLNLGGADAAVWRPADLASGRIKNELLAITGRNPE